jgi:hypothetical protein
MNNETINERIKFFFEHKTKVHLKKICGTFYNGLILEYSDKHLIFFDQINGDCFVLLSEIKLIEPFKEIVE